jgi:hypothetical protein
LAKEDRRRLSSYIELAVEAHIEAELTMLDTTQVGTRLLK